jgi:signal transduction histidine kinase
MAGQKRPCGDGAQKKRRRAPGAGGASIYAGKLALLAREALDLSNHAIAEADFQRIILGKLVNISDCDAVELCIERKDADLINRVRRTDGRKQDYEQLRLNPCGPLLREFMRTADEALKRRSSIRKNRDNAIQSFSITGHGSLYAPEASALIAVAPKLAAQKFDRFVPPGNEYETVLLIPLKIGDYSGRLRLAAFEKNIYTNSDILAFEDFSRTISTAVVNQGAQFALRERLKELTCLYEISRIADRHRESTGETLKGIVEILPAAFLYPESARARIVYDKSIFETPGFLENGDRITSPIIVETTRRGEIAVSYSQKKPALDEGPFLKEERSLIDTIALEVGFILERRLAGENSEAMEEQLRHADRLATIGQLAAGVAHELNEPLGAILGFAQLAGKTAELPATAAKDLAKIESASLHAREIIRKLMVFAKQTPPRKEKVDLNRLVADGLFFIEGRCVKANVLVELELEKNLPEITADPAQLNQVLVNLAVNAVQAMPKGGVLTVETGSDGKYVSLIVRDTGIGMDDETMRQIFLPFFTTKEVGEGTGLGLSVVHGIVTAHKGDIIVESEKGKGTTFKINFPVDNKREKP